VLGGEGGAGRLRGILELPRQTAGGQPAYPSIFDKAAAIFRSLILNHPFLDGNKRMAAASAVIFLHINGYVICASDRQLAGIALAVARGQMRSLETLERWFRLRSVSFDVLQQVLEEGKLPEFISKLPGQAALADRPLLQSTVIRLTGAHN